jgi:signal transduction histidine kinase
MLSGGMRTYPYLRSIVMGLVYLSLFLVSIRSLPNNHGIVGVGPWVAGGVSLGFLAVEGAMMIPWVVAAHLLAAQIFSYSSSLIERVHWPILTLAVLIPLTLLWRSMPAVRNTYRPLAFLGLALTAGICGGLLAFGGLILLKTATIPSALPVHSLYVGLLGAIVPGLLIGALSIAGFCCPDWSRLNFRSTDFLLEFSVQVVALAVAAWLVAVRGPVWWSVSFLVLIWICLRHGVTGTGIVIGVLLFSSSQHRSLTLPNQDGFQPIMAFELAVVGMGLGVGAYTEYLQGSLKQVRSRMGWVDSVLSGIHSGLWEWNAGGGIRYEGPWDRLCAVGDGVASMNEDLWRSLVHPEDLDRVISLRDQHLRGQLPRFEADYRIRSASGFYRWVSDRGHVVARDNHGGALRMTGVCMDLSTKRHGESELARRLEAIDSASDPVAIADLHGNLCFANRGFRQLRQDRNHDGLQSRHLADYFTEPCAQMLLRDALPQARSSGQWLGEVQLAEQGGRVIPASLAVSLHKDAGGHPRYYVLIAREQLRAKAGDAAAGSANADRLVEQLARQDGLRAFAGGVVHTLNNVLMAVMGNATLARRDLPQDSSGHHFFHQIDQATQRGTAYCQSLQLISGRLAPVLAPVDLNALVREKLPVIAKELGFPERFMVDLNPDLPLFIADAGQLELLLRNLLKNAVEAYQSDPGAIRVRTHRTEIDPVTTASPAPSGLTERSPCLLLEVGDDGMGIDQPLQSRAFDAYYSTKSGHKGLGLAEVAGVVRGHGGLIRVVSERGKGCLMQVYLPIRDPAKLKARKEVRALPRWKGAGRVLVVDDEETVRDLATSMLEVIGFSPLVATTAKEAIRLSELHAKDLRLVLLDYALPDTNCEDTLTELSIKAPDVEVLLMSGHGEPEVKAALGSGRFAGIIGKPFMLEELRGKLRQILDKSPDAGQPPA